MCRYGYGGNDIPAMNMSGIVDYLCGHHALLAHAKVYELYHQEYSREDGEKLLLTVTLFFVELSVIGLHTICESGFLSI